MHLGFEPSGRVELETRPKDDFTRSPDACLDTLVVDYRGPSRWLTIEAEFGWPELAGAHQFQIGLYARPDRDVTCRVVLRIPSGRRGQPGLRGRRPLRARARPGRGVRPTAGGAWACHRRPSRRLDRPSSSSSSTPVTTSHLAIDYLTAYFA